LEQPVYVAPDTWEEERRRERREERGRNVTAYKREALDTRSARRRHPAKATTIEARDEGASLEGKWAKSMRNHGWPWILSILEPARLEGHT